jgi:hypothetical protein
MRWLIITPSSIVGLGAGIVYEEIIGIKIKIVTRKSKTIKTSSQWTKTNENKKKFALK